ncbi:hypothetical protein D3C84_372910 [compost metagenome]
MLVVQHRLDRHELWITADRFGHFQLNQLFFAPTRDAGPSLAQVVPERLQVGTFGELAGHANHRRGTIESRLGCRRQLARRLRARNLCHRLPAARSKFLQGRGQTVDRRMLEQQRHRHLALQLIAEQLCHLHRIDRITTHVEKAGVSIFHHKTQHLPPDFTHPLHRSLPRGGQGLRGRGGWQRTLGQGLAVDFAVGCHWQLRLADKTLGQHVLRQVLAQFGLDDGNQRRRVYRLFGLQVSHQHLGLGLQHHHCRLHRAMLDDAGFDLLHIDAMATQFDLQVLPAQATNIAVFQTQDAIAGHEHALPGTKRVIDKFLRRQLRQSVIPQSQAGTGNRQLPRHPYRLQTPVLVEDVQLGIANRLANGDAASLFNTFGAGPDSGFRGAIEIPRCHLRRAKPLEQGRRHAFSTTQHLQVRSRLPAHLKQQLPGGRSGLHQGRIALFDQAFQALGITGDRRLAEDAFGTAHQPEKQLQAGNIETEGGDGQQAIRRLDLQQFSHGKQKVVEAAVGHHHALGLAGGARGVHQIGQITSTADRQFRYRGSGIRGDVRLLAVQAQGVARHDPVASDRGLRQQQAGAAVFEHVVLAFGGIGRIQRDIRRAAVQYTEHRQGQIQRALHADRHFRPGADPPRAQVVAQRLGAVQHLAVTQGLFKVAKGNALGITLGLLAQPLQQVGHGRYRLITGVAALQQGPFVIADNLVVRQAALRCLQHAVQQTQVVRQQAFDAGPFEERGGIFDIDRHLVGAFDDFQFQLILTFLAQLLDHGDTQRRRIVLLDTLQPVAVGEVLMCESDAEQGALLLIARHLECLDQGREGIVAVVQGIYHGFLQAFEVIQGAGTFDIAAADRHHVHEVADALCESLLRTTQGRHADYDVLLLAVAAEQTVEYPQEQHRPGQPMAGAKRIHAHVQGRRKGVPQAASLEALAVAGSVGGQLKRQWRVLQHTCPVLL